MLLKSMTILAVLVAMVIAVVCIVMIVRMYFSKKEAFAEYPECTLHQFFTEGSDEFSNDEEADNYWLKLQSSTEQEVYAALMKEADEAEANNNLNDASIIRSKIEEMRVQRLAMRKKALQLLEGTQKVRERGLDMVPEPNSCTVKSMPKKVFDILGTSCNVTTVIGGKENVYSYPDILKPTQPDKVFTIDGVESCYLSFPVDIDKRVALVMVLNVLDAIGEKIYVDILEQINRLTNEALALAKRADVLKNITVPKSRQELQSSIDDYWTKQAQVAELSTKLRFAQSTNRVLEDENKQLDIAKNDIVEIWEHCNKQGKRFVLPLGLTVFDGEKQKLMGFSSIYFSKNRGIYVILYDQKYRPYTIRSSVDCLTKVDVGGGKTVNLNDSVRAVDVRKQVKHPANGMIISAANQNRVLDVYGASKNDLAEVIAWDAVNTPNQKWVYNAATKQVVSSGSGKCLDALHSGTTNGTKIIQYQCHGGNNMKWDFLSNGLIRNVNANKCIQAKPGSKWWTTSLQSCNPFEELQKWYVVDDLTTLK